MEKFGFGFKNFKKFKYFPIIDLAPITLVVGPNNSGKSSFIKALTFFLFNVRHLFCNEEYWKDKREALEDVWSSFRLWIEEVSFFQMSMSHLGWGDFSTSLNYDSEDNQITFSVETDDPEDCVFEFSFGVPDDVLEDAEDPYFKFRLFVMRYKTIFKAHHFSLINEFKDGSWRNYIEMDRDYANEIIEGIISLQNKMREKIASDYDRNSQVVEFLKYDADIIDMIKSSQSGLVKINITNVNERGFFIASLRSEIKHILPCPSLHIQNVDFIETHLAHHSFLLSKDNKNDYLAQTVIEFYSKFMFGSTDSLFWIRKWLRNFEIGLGFTIQPKMGGEYFEVKINKGRIKGKGRLVNLASLGTGSIHVFILLLRCYMAISKIKDLESEGDNGSLIFLVVEEPEANLHPSLQSLLTDLLKDVYKESKGRVRFIVETHSEYVIRRSQVLVAEESYADEKELEEKNPFKVYYFPYEGIPYDMQYLSSGRFRRKFGEGFFDEATRSALTISKIERRKVYD